MYILGIIIILLDGLLVYFIPSYFNNLNIFYPMLSIVFLVSMYGYCNNYFKMSIILGFLYDLLYSNIFLYNTLIFLLLSKINRKIFTHLRVNLFNKIIVLVLNIIVYDTINFLIVYFSKHNVVVLNDLIYKISHSLIFNILFILFINLFLKKFQKNSKANIVK